MKMVPPVDRAGQDPSHASTPIRSVHQTEAARWNRLIIATGQCALALASDLWSASRRQLELELLHQWSTVTFKSYCGTVVEEYYNWQVVVPQLALKHDCLLHGMLAMSALEIAAFAEGTNDELSEKYVNIALEYHNLASCSLRTELTDVTPDNRQALFALSSILMVMGASTTALRFTTWGAMQHVTLYDDVPGAPQRPTHDR